MDPNAALLELRQLAKIDWTGVRTDELTPHELSLLHIQHCRMCELFEGLDNWLRHGGFKPNSW